VCEGRERERGVGGGGGGYPCVQPVSVLQLFSHSNVVEKLNNFTKQ